MTLSSLTGVSQRYARARPARTLVTVSGIALGVAVFFGVVVSNGSMNRFYERMADDVTGRSDVTAQAVGDGAHRALPADALARVRASTGVIAAVPALYAGVGARVTEVPPNDPGLGAVTTTKGFTLAGTDFGAARAVSSFPVGHGRLPRPGADELILAPLLAHELHASVGATVTLIDGDGTRPFTVVGLFVPGSWVAYTTGGWIAYTTLDAAQAVLHRPGQITTIDVRLAEGTRPDRWLEDNRALFGPDANVVDTAALFAPLRNTFKAPSQGFYAMSTLALWLAAFLIYLTMSMNVLERTRLFGGLFALGASRSQVRRLVLTEAAVMGAVGSLAGLVFGLGLAVILLRLTAQWFRLAPPPIAVSPIAAGVAFLAGCVTTVAAAALPARHAARLSPVEALRLDAEPATAHRRTWRIALPLLAVGASTLVWSTSNRLVAGVMSVCLLLGSVLIVPSLLSPLARVTGQVTSRIERGMGRVAVMHLTKERSRSSFTLALVMVVLAIAVGFAAATGAVHQVDDHQLAAQFGADLRLFHDGFGPRITDLIQTTPGVDGSTTISFATASAPFADRPSEPARFEAIDPATYFGVAGFSWASGDTVSARDALARGGAVLLPMLTASHLGIHRGDDVRITGPRGTRTFRLAATFVSLIAGPAVVMSNRDATALVGQLQPSEVDVRVEHGTSATTVRQALTRRAAALNDGFGFSTSAEIAANVRAGLDQATNLYNALLLVSLIVSMLGLANTLAMSVIARRREIGVLRSIGAGRLGIARMVVTESATLVAVALVLALPLGAVVAVGVIRSLAGTFGFGPSFVYPWAALPGIAVMGIVIALLASVVPARRAARLDIVDALRVD